MKLFPLIVACLTVLSTTAQVPNLALADDSQATLIAQNTFEPTLAAQSADEYAPLSNEPFFPGGPQALGKHLSNIGLYPESQLEGTVRVQFRVMPTGHLAEIRVIKSCGRLLDQAAIRAVVLMPRWYPAHREGVAVSGLVELPITFRLD